MTKLRLIKARLLFPETFNVMAKNGSSILYDDARRLVLVDDDASLLEALIFSFETQGFRVCGYHDAEEALSKSGEDGACFVIDQNLPGMSGLDMIERLRADGVHAPAILITTQPTQAMRTRARHAHAEIVEKPLLGDALGNEVRRLMETAS